ncbi:MAG: molybdenum cofactor biosynthesis protein MoaE [Hyphomonadaceae bacterium]
MKRVVIVEEAFNPGLELARLTGQTCDGAIASFVGQVREGEGVTHLELQHFPGLTERALARIADEATKRWSLTQALIIHRVGWMSLGDPIVLTAASAPGRRAALEAVAYMIDVLKTEAPFWKKEIGDDFERWVEPSQDDASRATRWLEQKEKT